MSSWRIVFSRQAQKDAKKLAAAGLKPKTEKLLNLMRENPFVKPPRDAKLVGDLFGLLLAAYHYPASTRLRGAYRREDHPCPENVDPLRVTVAPSRLGVMRLPGLA